MYCKCVIDTTITRHTFGIDGLGSDDPTRELGDEVLVTILATEVEEIRCPLETPFFQPFFFSDRCDLGCRFVADVRACASCSGLQGAHRLPCILIPGTTRCTRCTWYVLSQYRTTVTVEYCPKCYPILSALARPCRPLALVHELLRLELYGYLQYLPAMFDEGITIELLPTLGHNELKELGVATLGARMTFMAAVKLPEDVPPEREPEPEPEVERTFATSNFKREYDESCFIPITLSAQTTSEIQKFVFTYCRTVHTTSHPSPTRLWRGPSRIVCNGSPVNMPTEGVEGIC